MAETMYDAPGVGLAATQVDVHERVIVIDVTETHDQLMVFINPEIIWSSPEKQVYDEGCLSVPGIYDGVERPARVKVQGRRPVQQAVRDRMPTACWRCASSTRWIT